MLQCLRQGLLVNMVPKLRLLLCFIPCKPVKLIYRISYVVVSMSLCFVDVELYRRLIFVTFTVY